MRPHFNKLTPAQAERLACLAEECAEVIQVVGKIMRHGYASVHPVSEEDNVTTLERELGDLRGIVLMMCTQGDVKMHKIEAHSIEKLQRVKKYLHHN